MVQLGAPVEPFGEVNVNRLPDGRVHIKATILFEPNIEGMQTGLALDGSESMKGHYGISGVVFGPLSLGTNVMEPITRNMTTYLAGKSVSGEVELVYWACGLAGDEVERIGSISATRAESLTVRGPQVFGRRTHCLPVLRHLVQTLSPAPWSIAVIVTDGLFDDFQQVREYTYALADEFAAGQRNFVKLVVVGIPDRGNAAGSQRMREMLGELDDLFESCRRCDDVPIPAGSDACPRCGWKVPTLPNGDSIDIWDHKMADEITHLAQIFAEVVSENIIVLPEASIEASGGQQVIAYPNAESAGGMPALLEFELPRGSTSFTLVTSAGRFTQDITAGLQ